ncbi:N-acetyltransferase [Niastella caeni]|uniref:N-acetyltransferase n=1 Tax=Niastella caeni TaxID=2569763 RepID=A0A4S8I3Z6_9BACT|nr:N-acetyltransferase [Niastella caeni]THU41944.1 N-acetyltransferase [Niastella caeni]
MNISIRPEQPADIDEIYELNKLVFGQDNEAKLVDHVRQGSNFIPQLSLVAFSDDELIGYILFSQITISNGDYRHLSLGLTSMVVHSDYQKRGIGAKLITYGLQKAADLGFTDVFVFGHEYYFPKFGFLPANRWNIKPPFEAPAEVFMALELIPNALSNVSGIVEYPIEFSVM